jgi:hypothetical protein
LANKWTQLYELDKRLLELKSQFALARSVDPTGVPTGQAFALETQILENTQEFERHLLECYASMTEESKKTLGQ